MCGGQAMTQSMRRRGSQDEMHVIRHQAERETGDTCRCACFGDQAQVERIIALREEYLLPPVATLRDMVREARNDNAGESGHK